MKIFWDLTAENLKDLLNNAISEHHSPFIPLWDDSHIRLKQLFLIIACVTYINLSLRKYKY